MSERHEFREQFRIMGTVNHGKISDEEEIRRWSESPSDLLQATWVKLALWGVPLINIVLLAGGLTGMCSMSWFGLVFMLFVIISFAIIKRATISSASIRRKTENTKQLCQTDYISPSGNMESN